MTRKSAARIAAAILFAGGLAIAPLLDNSDRNESLRAHPQPAQPPQFRIQRRQHEIALIGHTISHLHEQNLLVVASATYPDARIITDFEPLGLVPDYWADITLQALYLLAETRSAEAVISTADLAVRGVIDDELGWQSRLAAIKQALPTAVGLSANSVLVDSELKVSGLCRRAFGAFTPGSIEFVESGTDLRSSAYPRLDRIVALANACQDSRILITGHTDSSGNAALNQDLSLRRANSVADYLVNSGIDPSRLVAKGAGSSQPIASDNTRHGRGLNRRIEIVFESL